MFVSNNACKQSTAQLFIFAEHGFRTLFSWLLQQQHQEDYPPGNPWTFGI